MTHKTYDLMIRSSSVEFLIFERQIKEKGIDVRYEKGDLWLTKKGIADLYGCTLDDVELNLQKIYEEKELDSKTTTLELSIVEKEGKRKVTKKLEYYSLDLAIFIGYYINSNKAIQFRRWATKILKEYSKKGYIIDKTRMINGYLFNEDYFNLLLLEIEEIRASERRFYQKITDLYATSVDYDAKSPVTLNFYKNVKHKMYFAVTRKSFEEIIFSRVNYQKEAMGLTDWYNFPKGKILKADVVDAKNYLTTEELCDLERITCSFLDLAEQLAKNRIPMTMEDWADRVDKYFFQDDFNITEDTDKITEEIALDKALTEFKKYRVIQDYKFKSDFDLFIEDAIN